MKNDFDLDSFLRVISPPRTPEEEILDYQQFNISKFKGLGASKAPIQTQLLKVYNYYFGLALGSEQEGGGESEFFAKLATRDEGEETPISGRLNLLLMTVAFFQSSSKFFENSNPQDRTLSDLISLARDSSMRLLLKLLSEYHPSSTISNFLAKNFKAILQEHRRSILDPNWKKSTDWWKKYSLCWILQKIKAGYSQKKKLNK